MDLNIQVQIFLIFFWSFGTIGNIFSISMCLRKELRKTPTFAFMAFICLLNICSLTTLIACPDSLKFFQVEKFQIHLILCKLSIFITFWSQSSSYLQVKREN
jgi:predicted membrane channel-forming protein YqfA (hemolysin III family)